MLFWFWFWFIKLNMKTTISEKEMGGRLNEKSNNIMKK